MNDILLAVLLFVAFLVLPNILFASPAKDISQDDLLERQSSADKDYFLLDVRTKQEFNQGHISGATNISHSDLAKNLNKVPKDKDLIIYCRSGMRARVAANLLSKNGYERLFHLAGDMNGWMANKKPVLVGN